MSGDPGNSAVHVLAGVLDLLKQPLALVDRADRLAHVNPPLARLFRRRTAELLGVSLQDVVANEPSTVDEAMRLWRSSGHWRPGRLDLRRADGEVLTVQCRGVRLAATDLIVLELTERADAGAEFAALNRELEVQNLRRMETRLQSSLDELEAVNQRLEAANAELDRYASMVAHDIRTPFSAIARFTDLIAEDHGDELPDDARSMLAAVGRLADRGQEVTEALLSLARIGAPEPVAGGSDSDAVADRVERDLETLIEGSGAKVLVESLPKTPMQPAHLERVLTNLITNALKYASPERAPVITLSGRTDGDTVQLSVGDNGVGVPPEEHERIFEPLVRGASASDLPGTGVGLATCRRIIEAYGGQIGIVESSDRGTTLAFTLPAVAPSDPLPGPA